MEPGQQGTCFTTDTNLLKQTELLLAKIQKQNEDATWEASAVKMTCKVNLGQMTTAPPESELWKSRKYGVSATSLNRVLFCSPSPKVSLRKFNLALIHQATLVSLKTSNFKIKYSFDFQARSREQGSLALTSQGYAPRRSAVTSMCCVAMVLDY